ncbi:MAG: D-Ala-D-Ala carboxypeptidase family metallohydrolase [Planctomycetota bacterium]|nr:D-Ala-D-Ala carboxypeptidase family metallohydrolase [Planctomycetota bacterium]
MITELRENLPWPAAFRRNRNAWAASGMLIAAGIAGYAAVWTLAAPRPAFRNLAPSGTAAAPEARPASGLTSVPAAAAAGFESWIVSVDPPGEDFSGTYYRDDLLFVPPRTVFRASAVPVGSGHLKPPAEWFEAGGRWREGGIPGESAFESPPKAGLYALAGGPPDNGGAPPSLRVFVMIEADFSGGPKGGAKASVAGIALGVYPNAAASGIAKVRDNPRLYRPPRFFAFINPANENVPMLAPARDGSPSPLSFGQAVGFIERYEGGKKIHTTERHINLFPPSRPLYLKLARLGEALARQGVRFRAWAVNSGFRSPVYNASIGGAAFSRHCYGDAADIMIDEDGDRRMDDLNGDGIVDRNDALIIAETCRRLELDGAVKPGGIGLYECGGDQSVGAFVHVDARGIPARWGYVPGGRRRVFFRWWPKSDPGDVDEFE